MTEAHEGVQEFFAKLPAAIDDSATQMLTLQTTFPTVYEQNQILVRQCYRELYDKVQSNTNVHRFVITGTPGIGKSVCALYFFYRLIVCGKTVLYQAEDIFYRFSAASTVKIGTRMDFNLAGYFDDKVPL
jgi:putative protein kinase ArgK-like GTPase of G3E family